ncbi:MAG: transporter substrate-binding domain-containing protein [Alphaproteobacteria bacterium]|nr:transporter substrate-binding domain-containing protein [Alphaproteobacteria bacterium]
MNELIFLRVSTFIFAVLTIGTLSVSSPTHASDQDSQKLVFATTTFPPFTIHDNPDTPLPGYINELVIQAFKQSGKEAAFKILPWKRANQLALDGKVTGTFRSTKTEKDEDEFFYSKPFSSLQSVFFASDHTLLTSISTIDDLKDKKVVANLGYSLSRILTAKNIAHEQARNSESALKQIFGGRAEIYYAYEAPVMWTYNQMRQQENLPELQKKPVAELPYYLIISKKVQSGDRLISLFDTAIANMKTSG